MDETIQLIFMKSNLLSSKILISLSPFNRFYVCISHDVSIDKD